MDALTRLQMLTEVVTEFKTALLSGRQPDQIGRMVVDIANDSEDGILYDHVLNAYLKMSNEKAAVEALDEATRHLHEEIDKLL